MTDKLTINSSPENMSIAWLNLGYEVNDLQNVFVRKKKVILQKLNGYFEYHTLNGLMGPSGAGKSTLMKCLSGRMNVNHLSRDSRIFLNSTEKFTSSYFIEQLVHENVTNNLTVKELLRYAFLFKNSTKFTTEEIDQFIVNMLDELMLDSKILNRYFGLCSGGEQKRIAIGQELMSCNKPTFLFVDEPTTGLDSVSAYQVITVLKHLATNYRMTVIASIHVPNSNTLNLFSQLYILAKGGISIYSGPPLILKLHLEKEIGLIVPKDKKPIEEIVKISCNQIENENVQKLSNQCREANYERISKNQTHLKVLPYGLPDQRKLFRSGDLISCFSRQFRITFVSEFQHFLFKIIACVLTILFISSFFNPLMSLPDGCVSLQNTNNNSTQCQNEFFLLNQNINYLVIVLLFLGFISMFINTLLSYSSIKVFCNEYRNRWYSLGTYYLSTFFVATLQVILFAIIFSTTSYFAAAEHAIDSYQINWTRFGNYILYTLLFMLYTQSIGQLIGQLSERIEISFFMSLFGYSVMAMLNDHIFSTDEIKSELLVHFSNLVGMKYITRYMIYVIYGIDRCDFENEFSWVLIRYKANPEQVNDYIWRIVQNIALLQLFIFIYMYLRYNTFKFKLINYFLKSSALEFVELEPINRMVSKHKIVMNQNMTQNRLKKLDEIEFENFSKSKIIIAWHNLSLFSKSYKFTNFRTTKTHILQNISGHFCFGTLNAVMGKSGAGKTSLLRLLNGHNQANMSKKSTIYLSKYTKISSSFITQEVSGHLFPELTAKQILIYASMFKNLDYARQNNIKINHEKIALNILKEFDMENIAGTKVELCSGGERKRLTLALELTSMQMPNLICFDEPTSGLDSNTAETVMACFRNLAKKHNLAIIASVHQPTTTIVNMFDQIYLLARGGVCIYSGHPTDIVKNLSKIPEINTNESQYLIDLIIEKSCTRNHDSTVQKLIRINEENQLPKEFILNDTQIVFGGVMPSNPKFTFNSTFILCIRYLAYIKAYLWKEYLIITTLCVIYAFALKIFFDPSIAQIPGCFNIEFDFNNTCTVDVQRALADNANYNLFMCHIFLLIISVQTGFGVLRDIELFSNEHRNGWYHSTCYYLMKSLFDILPTIPIVFIYVYICNIYENIQPGIYLHIVLVMFINIVALQAFAYIVALLSYQSIIITAINLLCAIISLVLFSNTFVFLNDLNSYYIFFSNFSIIRFTFNALVLLEFGFGRCAEREIQLILYSMKLKDEDYSNELFMMIFNLILYRVIALFLLNFKFNAKENSQNRKLKIVNYIQDLEPSTGIISGISNSSYTFRIKIVQ